MTPRQALRSQVLAALALGAAAAVEMTAEGVPTLLGFVVLGSFVGGWVAAYGRVLCRAERLSMALVLPWVIRGAVVLPGLAALHLVFGMTVWVALILALGGWALRTTLRWC